MRFEPATLHRGKVKIPSMGSSAVRCGLADPSVHDEESGTRVSDALAMHRSAATAEFECHQGYDGWTAMNLEYACQMLACPVIPIGR